MPRAGVAAQEFARASPAELAVDFEGLRPRLWTQQCGDNRLQENMEQLPDSSSKCTAPALTHPASMNRGLQRYTVIFRPNVRSFDALRVTLHHVRRDQRSSGPSERYIEQHRAQDDSLASSGGSPVLRTECWVMFCCSATCVTRWAVDAQIVTFPWFCNNCLVRVATGR